MYNLYILGYNMELIRFNNENLHVDAEANWVTTGNEILCSRCGGAITDLSEYPNARVCKSCRELGKSPVYRLTRKYGDFVKKYLDEVGWPTYPCAKEIVRVCPDILGVEIITKSGKPLTNAGKISIVSVCLLGVVGDEGQTYVPYTNNVHKLKCSGGLDVGEGVCVMDV